MRENHGTFSRKNSDSLSCNVTYFPNFVILSFHEIFRNFLATNFSISKEMFLKNSQFLFTNNQTRGFSVFPNFPVFSKFLRFEFRNRSRHHSRKCSQLVEVRK